MSGVTAIGTVTDLQTMTAVIIAAMGAAGGGNNNNRGGDRNFKEDSRPQAPPVSMAVRDARIAAGNCERCDESPSHRWSKCHYKNFRENPTQRGSSRTMRVNNAETGNA